MQKLSKWLVICLTLVMAATLTSCSKDEPAIAFTKEFIKKAATGDKSLKNMIDFQAAAAKYGTSEQEIVKKEGAQKWEEAKDDMVKTIMTSFAPLKSSYKKAFKDFEIEEKGVDYWVVTYWNPAKERKRMKVAKQKDGSLKGYFFTK